MNHSLSIGHSKINAPSMYKYTYCCCYLLLWSLHFVNTTTKTARVILFPILRRWIHSSCELRKEAHSHLCVLHLYFITDVSTLSLEIEVSSYYQCFSMWLRGLGGLNDCEYGNNLLLTIIKITRTTDIGNKDLP